LFFTKISLQCGAEKFCTKWKLLQRTKVIFVKLFFGKMREEVLPLPLAGSISSMFYKQFMHAQIPKAQKKYSHVVSLFALLGSAHVKSACRTLMKLTPAASKLFFYLAESSVIP